MEGFASGEYRSPAAARSVSELAHDLYRAFVGFRPAVAEEHAGEHAAPRELFGKLRLGHVVVKVGRVYDPARLVAYRFDEVGIVMPETADRDTAEEIGVRVSRRVVQRAALAAFEADIAAAEQIHVMFFFYFFYFLEIHFFPSAPHESFGARSYFIPL